MEFVFEPPVWQQELDGSSGEISAARFLTVLEPEDPASVEEAMAWLDEKQITLDIRDLPVLELTGNTALRLKQESELPDAMAATEGLDENDPLKLYLQELSAVAVAGDPQLLAERYSAGEKHLAEQLVNLHLGLVVELAMDYTGHGVLLLDLIQEGSLGLWQAITVYCQGDFTQQARWWIRHYMAKAVTLYARSAGVGQKLRQGMTDYLDADQYLLSQLGRNPTQEEIAEHLHLSCEEIAALEKMVSEAKSLQKVKQPEAPVEQEEEQAVEDTAYFQLRQRIEELLSALPPQDAKLLTLRFGLEGKKPMTPVQVGEILGLTPQQVLRREEAALALLRNQ